MTVDQAVQCAYMAPNAFNSVNSFDYIVLIDKIRARLINIEKNCPQSQEKDRVIYQYKHAIRVINQFIN